MSEVGAYLGVSMAELISFITKPPEYGNANPTVRDVMLTTRLNCFVFRTLDVTATTICDLLGIFSMIKLENKNQATIQTSSPFSNFVSEEHLS